MNDSGSVAPLILVVDDEPALRDAICYSLKREGWRVETAADGPRAIESARNLDPALIVLDIMLPGLDGLQVCRVIRSRSNVPILFLSAKGEDVDRIVGLEIGGDDYLVKPFVMRELVARVRAHLRRSGRKSDVQPVVADTTPITGHATNSAIELGPVAVDIPARRVRLNGTPIAIKPKEFDLLVYFMRNPGVAVSRDSLLREVWKYELAIDTRTVDVHIRALRQKIERNPSQPEMIETIRGYGYRFNAGPH